MNDSDISRLEENAIIIRENLKMNDSDMSELEKNVVIIRRRLENR